MPRNNEKHLTRETTWSPLPKNYKHLFPFTIFLIGHSTQGSVPTNRVEFLQITQSGETEVCINKNV